MPGALQVRQGHVSYRRAVAPPDTLEDAGVRWSGWTDVPSPGWLFGYVLPHPELIYEFRHEPEGSE